MTGRVRPRVVIVGGGIGGLAAAYDITRAGLHCTVFEQDESLGGLAGTFDAGGFPLEKFYHHWYTSDTAALELVRELGMADALMPRPSTAAAWVGNRFWKLSTPLDLLCFSPLSLRDRLRLGLLTLRVRRLAQADLPALEQITAIDWVRREAGQNVLNVMFEPLLRGKFGPYAEQVAAVWLAWKLRLRGSSRRRGGGGREQLVYLRGGFGALVDALARQIRAGGGTIQTGMRVAQVLTHDHHDAVRAVRLADGTECPADAVLLTCPQPVAAGLCPFLPPEFRARLTEPAWLGNICLILVLERPLSGTYWLNVNDPSFPFVAVIEHTNLDASETAYRGRHIVYLSTYLPPQDPRMSMSADELLVYSIGHLQRMFPAFKRSWVHSSHVWRADYAQPVVTVGYRQRIAPEALGPRGLRLCCMAQIYPEDRGTNYAIAYARRAAARICADLGHSPHSPVAGPLTTQISLP